VHVHKEQYGELASWQSLQTPMKESPTLTDSHNVVDPQEKRSRDVALLIRKLQTRLWCKSAPVR
jgi:hypothetical protein